MDARILTVASLACAASLWAAGPAPSAAGGAEPASGVRWGPDVLRQPSDWYASVEARAIADSVLQYQSPHGGWPKNTDLAVPPRPGSDVPQPGHGDANTIDNDATTLPMRFLALVVHATGDARSRSAFERGLHYLLEAQYPNGGWPQYYPLREGYYSRITYNDNAMVNVLELLRDVNAGGGTFAFIDRGRREQAGRAVELGLDVILRTQIRQNGRLTAWCAQHDEKTLAPAWARNYEPPSLSGSETVGIVRFLMSLEHPSPAIVAAVEGAVAWLDSVTIEGLRLMEFTADDGQRDRRAVADPSAGRLWARFYELVTDRPIFLGRDRVVRYDYNELERERRVGYAYLGTWPARLLEQEYPRWRDHHTPTTSR
jgi:PelA/Pel-15E family pectate lyase